MARFNSTQEVRDYALRAARDDIRRHQEHGIDLNPFCTVGARGDWQRGFDNVQPPSWSHDISWDTMYQRGRACADLLSGVAA